MTHPFQENFADKEILKEKNNVVACLLNGVTSDSRNNILGNDGSSLKSNLHFCKDIVKLSKIFKNKNFIIKHKMIIDPVLNDESIKRLSISVSDVDEYILGHNELITAVNKIIYSSIMFALGPPGQEVFPGPPQSELVIGFHATPSL